MDRDLLWLCQDTVISAQICVHTNSDDSNDGQIILQHVWFVKQNMGNEMVTQLVTGCSEFSGLVLLGAPIAPLHL